MAEAIRHVEDDVVRTGSVARHTVRNEIEREVVAQLPGDHVVAAGRVAADSDAPHAAAVLIVERQAAAEDVDPSDAASHHRIGRGPERLAIATICDVSAHGIAVLEPEEAASGLHGLPEICRRKRQALERAVRSLTSLEAEAVRGVRLLR